MRAWEWLQSIMLTVTQRVFLSQHFNLTRLLLEFDIKMINKIRFQLSETGVKLTEANSWRSHTRESCKSKSDALFPFLIISGIPLPRTTKGSSNLRMVVFIPIKFSGGPNHKLTSRPAEGFMSHTVWKLRRRCGSLYTQGVEVSQISLYVHGAVNEHDSGETPL